MINKLSSQMLPKMEKLSDGDYVFLQDRARSHTTKKSFAYLDEHCTEYVKPDFWLPNSPDMNMNMFMNMLIGVK